MLPVLVGLTAAMIFGIASFLVYGLDGLMHYEWIEMVFWTLIGVGALISIVDSTALRTRVCRIVRSIAPLKGLCEGMHCAG